jgi:SNF2 family DNA or RNA helicase
LIFTCFRDAAAKLEEGVQKILKNYGGGKVVSILGGDRWREKKLDAFKDDPDTQVMILSILAGGTGIDLPNIVDDVIMNDYSWTPMEAEQAEGRAYRVTSENDVNTRYVLAADTVDEDFFALVQKKRKLAAIIDHATSSEEKIKAAQELKKANQEMFEAARRRAQERKQASSWLARVIV